MKWKWKTKFTNEKNESIKDNKIEYVYWIADFVNFERTMNEDAIAKSWSIRSGAGDHRFTAEIRHLEFEILRQIY